MEITNEAKIMLEDLFKSNGGDSLKAMLKNSCCGSSVVFSIVKKEDNEEPVLVNDVPVIMGEGVSERAETVIMTVENGELSITDSKASSCC